MEPEEFISFEDERPKQKKWIIVTNNLEAKDNFGEMSHVWLTIIWIDSVEENDGIVMFDEADRKIRFLTHWKYA